MAPPARSHSPPLPPQAVFKHDSLSLALRPDRLLYLAGSNINGVLELSCSSDKAWLGRIALELRGAEYLESLDHAASQTFLNAEVTFQSSSLPPSNAVLATSPSSSGYWPARSGVTRFSFSFPLPTTCPTSCRFANNASIKYTLTATVQVQYKGERQILTKRLDVQVVERWTDWQDEQFREPAEAQKRVRASAGGGALNLFNSGAGSSAEGSVWIEARIQEPLFYRGYDLPGGGVEKERSKGTVGLILSVKNATSRTLSSGIKLSLLRRLKILPGEGNTSSSEDLRPKITEEVEHVSLNGREWEFSAIGEERIVHCGIDLPKQDRYLSIRKTKLFEVHTFLKVTLGMGALSKDIDLELPIWVAHYASLPREAFKPRSIPVPGSIPFDASALASRNGAISPYGRSPSVIPPPQQQHQFPHGYFPQQNAAQRSFFSEWPTGQAPVSPATSPIPFASPYSIQPQSTQQQQQYIAFDANAPDLTQSRFCAHLDQPNLGPAYHAGSGMQRSNSAMAFSAPSLQHATPSYSSQSPARYHQGGEATLHMQQFASIPRSMSADPYRTIPGTPDRIPAYGKSNVSPGWQRTLSPGIVEFLSPEEQQRVLANSAPASYDAAARAYQQPRQPGALRSPDRSPSRSPAAAAAAAAGRRQSMPSPSSHAAPLQQRSNSFSPDATGQYISNGSNRPIKTPPLAPSSRFTPPANSLHEPPLTTIQGLPPPLISSGLETIGEDGESQAGTLRFKTLPRSLSFDDNAAAVVVTSSPSARGGSQISIRSVKAVYAPGASMDDEGNTSVSLLEEMVDRQDREKEAAAAVAAAAIGGLKAEELGMRELLARSAGQTKALIDLDGADKSPPKPPVPSGKESKTPSTSTTKPNIRNIFTISASSASHEQQTIQSPAKPHVSPGRRVSQPLVPSIPIPSKPLIKPSNSESLLALESRLSSSSSRPTSPISPTSPLPESAAAGLSGVFRSMTLSPPLGRAISPAPLHVGNAGALRKKSSQISLKRQQSKISLASLPGAAETILPSTLVDVKSPPIAKARIAESSLKSPNASQEAPKTTTFSTGAETATTAFGDAAASKAKEAAARVRKSLDSSSAALAAATRKEWSRASKVESAKGDSVKQHVPVRSREEKVNSPAIRPAREDSTPAGVTAVKIGSPQPPQPPKPFFAHSPPKTTASPRSSPPPAKAIATSPDRMSLPEKALPKRLVSDPSHSPKRSVSPALIERTNQASRRRHSIEPEQRAVSPDTDKYGSLRGGRGGQVTDVAKQWATLIAAGKSQPVAEVVVKDRDKRQQPLKVVSKAKPPEMGGSPASGQLSKAPATAHRLAVGGGRALNSSKAAPAKTFTNTTIGKSPVFSKSLPTQATVAPVTRSVSDPEGNSKKEQAQGPGSDRLKALISKFS